ncbi:conserved TLD domain protein [Trypanosoma conorhini]|uniref:Oxidation resistance protein 1 n=1 Tax=Trypanosoma conorhini TaxID=83891 RepID=A0A3R7RYP6_9TRYP|nr:conserved TLD domain protein [Trypanosoma conorhini]RNF15953.1 conserved TLD domain protein [Trypanosoma conorhini]
MQHVRRLEKCIKRCEDDMERVNAVVKSSDCSIAENGSAWQLWETLETDEAALVHVLAVCDTFIHSCRFRVMCLFSQGNEILAQMQLAKQRLLRCFSSVASKQGKGGTTTAASGSSADAGESATITQLVSGAPRLLCELRDREQQLIDNALMIKRDVFHSSRGEGDVMLELHAQQEGSPRGMTPESLLHIFPLFPEDAARETHAGTAAAALKNEHGVGPSSPTGEADTIWTDLRLMNISLRSAFAAAACKHHFAAAYDFAFVTKLVVTKCFTAEELLMTVLALESGRSGDSSPQHDVQSSEGATSPWVALMLSDLHANVLPKEAFLTRENLTPPYYVSLIFASLVWNTAFCLWQKGCVKEAHQWLCEVDVERLLVLAAAKEKEDAGADVNGIHGLHTRRHVMKYCLRPSLETCMTPSHPGTSTHVDESCTPKELQDEPHEAPQIHHLLRRIVALREVCAMLLSCTTPQDVLFLILQMQHALRWQMRCSLHQDDPVGAGEDVPTTGGSPTDATAEALTVVVLIVEYYLTQRAMATVEASASSDAFLPVTVDAAVQQACDELIYFLSSGRLTGVEDVEQRGIPPSWHLQYDGDDKHDARGDDPERAKRPPWLSVQVLGTAQAFASGFHGSVFYQCAVAAHETRAVRREAQREAAKPAERRSSWSASLANMVQSAARLIIKGVGSSWEEVEDAGTASNFSSSCSELRPSRLVPQCFKEKQYLRAKQGTGILWIPSLHGVGVQLLPEEEVVEGPYKGFDDVAWRLLVVACRYSNSQSLVSLTSHDGARSGGGPLEMVVPELNNAVRILMSNLNNRAGDRWWPLWHQQRNLSAGRARIGRLLEALDRGTYMSVMRAGLRRATADDGAQGNRAPQPAAASKKSEDVVKEHTGEETEAVSGLWDFPPPKYIPPLQFDFSAFASGSAQAFWATQQLVEDLSRRQNAADKAASTGNETPAEDNSQSLSLLTTRSRHLLHQALPGIWQFMPWKLIYSSRFHGFSFTNMLSCSQRVVDAARRRKNMPPMLLVMEVVSPNGGASIDSTEGPVRLVIGAFLSHPLHVGTHRFYGNSDTFVFQLLISSTPASTELRVYRATGKNQQFIKTTSRSLAVGGGGGCSVFLNNTVTHGSTAACVTFDAPPLTQWHTPPFSLSWSFDRASVAAAGEAMEKDAARSYAFDIRSIELLVVGEPKEP